MARGQFSYLLIDMLLRSDMYIITMMNDSWRNGGRIQGALNPG